MRRNTRFSSTGQAAGRHARTRRTTAIVAATAVAMLAGGQAAGASAATVDMERVVIASQLDQYRPNNATTAGAADDVKRIQRALRGKGFNVTVDGNFGGETFGAYAAWQRKLGSSGLGANGIPGPGSLRSLGFTLVNQVTAPGARSTYSPGVVLNARTTAMVKEAGRLRGCTIPVSKGSFTGPDSSSAGTHAGGGAIDVSVSRGGCGAPSAVVNALTKVGFAAWYRHTGSYVNNKHIHAIAISDLDMATEPAFPGVFDSREQIADWAQGKDGLSGAVVAPMPNTPLRTWEQYKRGG
jgi:peptidoglycan hydrolase-like protein with peptidoglycan-binding domain